MDQLQPTSRCKDVSKYMALHIFSAYIIHEYPKPKQINKVPIDFCIEQCWLEKFDQERSNKNEKGPKNDRKHGKKKKKLTSLHPKPLQFAAGEELWPP